MHSRGLLRRYLCLLLFFYALSTLSQATRAQGTSGSGLVTLKGENKKMREALKQLFGQTKVQYKLDKKAAALTESLVVSYNMTQVPLENALFVLLRSQVPNERLEYKKEKGVFYFYTIARKKHADVAPDKIAPSPIIRVSTVHMDHLPLRDALQLVLGPEGARIRFAPEVVEEVNKATVLATVSLLGSQSLQNVDIVLRAAHLKTPLTYWYRDGIYMFEPDKAELIKRKPYTLDLKAEALDTVLVRMLEEMKMSYAFVLPEAPQQVTLALQDCPFEKAVAQILMAARVSPLYQPDVTDDLIYFSNSGQGPATTDLKNLSSMRVTLKLKDTPLRFALKALFQPAGVNYTIAAEIDYRPVTLTLTNVPFITALKAVLNGTKGEPPCKYLMENGVCVIEP